MLQHELDTSFPSENLKEMLDSVGIRLPKYKVRELTLGMKESGDIGVGDIIEKMTFIQVTMIMNC